MLTFLKAYNVTELLTDRRFIGETSTVFTFPQTLGALFFGASLIVFYSTFKHVANAQLPALRKIHAFVAIDLLFIFGILAHVLDVNDARMYTSIYTISGENFINISVDDDHSQFIPKLHGFITIFSGWVAASLLVVRANVLVGRVRWFAFTSFSLVGAMILVQLIMYGLGFRAAWPAFPIVNLLVQIPVTIAVLLSAFKAAPDSKRGVLCVIEDVLADSGALLTAGLLVQTILPFVGVSFEPVNALLPHLQNIIACTTLVRLIDGDAAGGVLRLTSEESIAPAPSP